MPHKILKSLLPTEDHVNSFQRLVNEQIEKMRIHDAHMKLVAQDPENYHPYPADVAHPDIMAAIVKEGDDYNIEFEIEDDVTPPPLTLEEKKTKLSQVLIVEASQLQEKIFPARKRSLAAIENSKIFAIEEKDRTDVQKKSINDYQKKVLQLEKINHHYAEMEASIEDLTEANIDGWKPAPFSEFK